MGGCPFARVVMRSLIFMTNRYDEKERRIHCAFSEKCGGCDYAGMKYDNELAVKQKYIEELFGEYVKADDIVGMYRPIH